MTLSSKYKSIIIIVIGFVIHFSVCFPETDKNTENIKFYNFSHLKEDVLGVNTYIYSIYQDTMGYIWFASHSGLLRYDGYNLKRLEYTFKGSSRNITNRVYNIYELKSGIYIICSHDGLIKFDSKQGVFEKVFEVDTDNKVIHSNIPVVKMIQIDKHFAILQNYSVDLYLYDMSKNVIRKCQFSENPIMLSNIIAGNNHQILAGAIESDGLYELNINTDTMELSINHLNLDVKGHIYELREDNTGNFWIGTNSGIYCVDIQTGLFKKQIKENFGVLFMMLDSRNFLWFNSANLGFGFIDLNKDNSYELLNSYFDVNAKGVGSMFEDREGTIWLGSQNGGVYKLNHVNSDIEYFPQKHSNYSFDNVIHILKETEGNYWIATFNSGVYNVNNSRVIRHYRIPEDILCYSIQSLMINTHDDIFVGTNGNGIFVYDKESDTFNNMFTQGDHPNSQYVFAMTEYSDDRLLLGTMEGLYELSLSSNHWERLFPDIIDKTIHIITQVPNRPSQYLISGEDSGLYLFDSKEKTLKELAHNTDEFLIDGLMQLQFLTEPSNSIMFSTTTGDIFRYNLETESLQHIFSSKTLNLGSVLSFLIQDERNLWISTETGVVLFKPKTNEIKPYFELNKIIKDNVLMNMFKMGERIIMETDTSLISFDMNSCYLSQVEPLFSVTNLEKVDETGKFVEQPFSDKTVDLNYNDIIKISFSSQSFLAPEKNHYKYKLTRDQNNWISLGNQHSLIFTNLEPGSYSLELLGSNNDLVYNRSPYAFQLNISPPFYKSWWFRIIVISILSFALFKFYIIRMNIIKKKFEEKCGLDTFYELKNISKREVEIIEKIIQDKSREEIGEELFISPNTVRNHIYRIYRKLDVKNRGELVNILKHKFPGEEDTL